MGRLYLTVEVGIVTRTTEMWDLKKKNVRMVVAKIQKRIIQFLISLYKYIVTGSRGVAMVMMKLMHT